MMSWQKKYFITTLSFFCILFYINNNGYLNAKIPSINDNNRFIIQPEEALNTSLLNEDEKQSTVSTLDQNSISNQNLEIENNEKEHLTKIKKKKYTIIIYMAADNDLRSFAARNIKQMAEIGSSDDVTILVHLDIRLTGNQKVTRRYFIDSADRIIHVNAQDSRSQCMDSGDPQTVISCVSWAATDYPAEEYILIFWNHGTGILDPERGRIINPSELFTFNPITQKLDLDRSVDFFDWIEPDEKGVCWDDTTRNYLTNQKLDFALHYCCTNILHKKFAIIGFDACLMSMLEVAHSIKNYAQILIGSQEVELGTGWDYSQAFEQFSTYTPTPYELATNIVYTYHQTYNPITNDYTLSAIDLATLKALEDNVNTVSLLLIQCLKIQKNNSVKAAIRTSRSQLTCTHFDERSYIDLHDFYKNLQTNLKYFSFNKNKDLPLLTSLNKALDDGKQIINKIVFANTAGKNLMRAEGISIYFPEQKIHPSYPHTSFAKNNSWINFLTYYLSK